jgi:hypothetical protein
MRVRLSLSDDGPVRGKPESFACTAASMQTHTHTLASHLCALRPQLLRPLRLHSSHPLLLLVQLLPYRQLLLLRPRGRWRNVRTRVTQVVLLCRELEAVHA